MRYVQTFRQDGKVYHYFRASGVKQRLPGDPASPEYQARYRELLETVEAMRSPATAGSIEALIADYKRSPEYDRLTPETRVSYAHTLDKLRPIAKARTADLKRIHILKLRDGMASTPRTADLFVQVTRRLLSWAVNRGYLEVNPLLRIELLNEPESRIPWSEADCQIFEDSAPRESLMTAYMLGRYLGQRRGDVLRLTRNRYDGEGFDLVQSKTGAALWIPAHERLKAYLDGLPQNGLLWITTEKGEAWRGDVFSHTLRKHLRAIGLGRLSFHGLRHTAASALAEAGCSEREIMAITGHATSAMVSRYTAKADQRRRATAAIHKLERR